MTYVLSRHAEERMAQRGITAADVESALNEPLVSYGSRNAHGEVRVVEDYRIHVVVGTGDRVVTVAFVTGGRR